MFRILLFLLLTIPSFAQTWQPLTTINSCTARGEKVLSHTFKIISTYWESQNQACRCARSTDQYLDSDAEPTYRIAPFPGSSF
ncbi:MAG: hypothetical protein IPF93_14555 [Saprospiraceae bacterium]|nr:hypothetical protein [Saprospiraceae bacterium]